MKLHGGMPRGKFITRAQPAEKEDEILDQPNQKKLQREKMAAESKCRKNPNKFEVIY